MTGARVAHSLRMFRSARASAIAVVAVALGLAGVTSACTGDDDDTAPTTAGPQTPDDTGPTTTSARNTAFCAGMNDLAERLDGADETDDTSAMIRSAYADLDAAVPDEIRADFEAVRALLVAQAEGVAAATTDVPVTTSDPEDPTDATAAEGDGEGAAVLDTPSERLAAYVELSCRSTANNPGPPETQPP